MSLLPVHVEGGHLKTSDGKRFKAVGCSDFAQFKRFLMPGGWAALVKPILDERKSLAVASGYDGPLVARVFRYAGNNNAFAIDPWSYSMAQATEFTQRLCEEGWYVDWTSGDSQFVLPNPNGPKGQQQHLNEFCAAMVACPNAWIQTSNEAYKNGIDVSRIVPPKWGTYLRDSGMYAESPWDHALDIDLIDFHPDRGDDENHTVHKWVGKAFETAVYLQVHGKPIIYKEPIGAAEVNKPGSRTNRPDLIEQMALVIGLIDGIYMHSTPGLSSDGFGPVVKECWKGFCRGVKAGLSI